MIEYRLATVKDNQQLIELTAASGMQGDIALRIDRRPDFFKLLNRRGESKVFVALDAGTIIGCICVSHQQVLIESQVYPLVYIGDFKIKESYRNRTVGFRLYRELEDYLHAAGTDLALANYSKGNTKPMRFFKNMPNLPDFEDIGDFKIHQFIGKKRTSLHPNFKIESTPPTEDLLAFFNAHYRNYALGALVTKEKLEDSDCYTIQHENKIIAAMCILDTMTMKQNVVISVSWKMKYLLRILNSVASIAGLSKMPAINEPVRMIYIKYLAISKPENKLLRLLIGYARNLAFERSYSFVSFGLHEKDPMNKSLKRFARITFISKGMILSMKDNKELISKIRQGIPFVDYSLV